MSHNLYYVKSRIAGPFDLSPKGAMTMPCPFRVARCRRASDGRPPIRVYQVPGQVHQHRAEQRDPEPPEEPQDRRLRRVRGDRAHQRAVTVIGEISRREISCRDVVVAARQHGELLVIRREVVLRKERLPLVLDQQQPRAGRIDEGATTRVEPYEIERNEERRDRHRDQRRQRDQREDADRLFGEQTENGQERRLDRQEMAETLLLERFVELQQVEIRLPLLEQSRFRLLHLPSSSRAWTLEAPRADIMRLRVTRTADAGASGLKCAPYAADISGIWFAWLRPTLSVMPIMETPLVTTVFLVLIAALWHRRFVRATRERCAEPFAKDCMRIGVVLLASGIVLFGDRVGTPTDAETLATVFFDAGGGVLLFLGAVSWATSNDAAMWLANLTGETLVFIAPDGEPLFTLHPQFGCAAVTLPDRKSTRLNSSHVRIS